MEKHKVVCSLSGGMDSSTLVVHLLKHGYDVECINFTYGSKHNQYEIACAEKFAKHYNVPYRLIDLSVAFQGFKSNLLKSGGEIPEGHYESENMTQTVVPGRNTIFASILLGYAESIGAKYIALGVHRGDHAIYPDCRKEYIDSLSSTFNLASDGKVNVMAPFVDIDKIEICSLGLAYDVPYELTRTCYKDQKNSCGKCGSCVERLEAFEQNDAKDPIKYEE